MQIQVRINEEGALRNQRYAFTDKSLLQELKLEKYPLLQGKTFQLRVGQNCGEHAVELIG